jgi:hypothetical protein
MRHHLRSWPAARRRTSPVAVLLAPLLAWAAGGTAWPQSPPWTFAAWGGSAAPSSTAALADYIATGQTPHPAVVRIVAAERAGASLGSGVLVDANRTQGLVLTNWHVVRDSRSAVLVQFPDGYQSAGTVIRWDEPWDLAAIAIWRPRAEPVPIAATPPAPGDQLSIAGYGRGPYRSETGQCTEYLSPGTGYPRELVELLATARQGDSGGPILNDRGELAGVLFGHNGGRTIGSCSTRVRTFLASVGSQGFTPTPIAEFSDSLAVDRSPGAADPAARTRIAQVSDGGPQPRSSHLPAAAVAAPAPPGFAPGPPAGPFGPPPAGMAAAWPPVAGVAAAAGESAALPGVADPDAILPAPADLAATFDMRTHGRTWLTAGGGLALMFLGLRILRGGRRAE